MRSPVRGASVLLVWVVALVVAGSPVAAAAPAPSTEVQVAVAKARAQFHTQRVHADGSLRSRRDPRWALVDGSTATPQRRLWATWLHTNGRGGWQLRYFDTTAPFRPQSTRRGRVPCDLYPAFGEALCPPSGPSAATIKAQVFRQLAPTGSAAKIDAVLRNGGYIFTFTPPVNGTLLVAWYHAPEGAHVTAAAAKPTLIARGNADSFDKRRHDHDHAHDRRQASPPDGPNCEAHGQRHLHADPLPGRLDHQDLHAHPIGPYRRERCAAHALPARERGGPFRSRPARCVP